MNRLNKFKWLSAVLVGAALILPSGVALAALTAPVVALPAGLPDLGVGSNGAVIAGQVLESTPSFTIDGFTITNNNTTSLSLTLIEPFVNGIDVLGDPSDAITVATVAAGGTCPIQYRGKDTHLGHSPLAR